MRSWPFEPLVSSSDFCHEGSEEVAFLAKKGAVPNVDTGDEDLPLPEGGMQTDSGLLFFIPAHF